MNNVKRIAGFVLLFGALFSCNNLRDRSANEESPVFEPGEVEMVYAFIASFYSPGNGIDHEIRDEYMAFVAAFEPMIAFETRKWGREGEKDFCFTLDELDNEQQAKFIRESKAILEKSDKVHIYEDSIAKH